MRATLLAIALVLAPAARAAPRPRRATSVEVVYVTAARAYLDRGASDGLEVGDKLTLRRNARAAGECTVEHVSRSAAVCAGTGLKVGDSARLVRPAAPAAHALPVHRLPAPRAPAEVTRLRQRLLAAPLPRVDSGTAAAAEQRPGALRVAVEAGHQSWMSAARGGTGYHRESVDVWIGGAPLPLDSRLFADVSVQQWTRPSGFLSPHRSSSQLFVRELAVTRREAGQAWVFSAGRVWPYRAASLGVFDGAQVGVRGADDGWEAGVFGGVVPDALNTAVDLRRPLVGAYGGVTLRGLGALQWLQQEAHLAWQPERGGSAQVLVRAWLPPQVDAAADLELGLAADGSPSLAALRADVGYRPVERVWVRAGSRYESAPLEVLPSVTSLGPEVRALHAELSAGWAPWELLRVSASVGHAGDLDSDLSRTWVGPEVMVPGLLKGALTLGAGYQEELGWLGGRSAWLWASARPAERVHLHLRGAWMVTGPALETGRWAQREWGLYASAGYALSARWSLRGAAVIRLAQEVGGHATASVAVSY